MRRFRQAPAILFLAVLLLAAGWSGPVRAGEERVSTPDTDAARLVEEVLRKAGGDDLGSWTRSILDRALERAGAAARQTVPGSGSPGSRSGAGAAGPGSPGRSTVPLPAERHAGGIIGGAGGRAGTAEVLIFMSLSVPPESWRQWAREAARAGAAERAGPPLVLRGVGAGGLPETARRIGELLGGAKAGVAIDPRLFRLFGIERVPAVVVVPGGGPGRSPVPPCRSRGCAEDPAPPHDLVTGNVGLAAALEAIAAEGAVARDVARVHLERLGREP